MILRVKRSEPATGARPRWHDYAVPLEPRMSVLDGLFWILEHVDGTLAFRYSCRAGMCGSCAMVINGREALACRVRPHPSRPRTHVEPLRSLPVIKDLVVDLAPFFAKYGAVDPYYVGTPASLVTAANAPAVVRPDSGARAVVDQQIGCISCGACFSACPVVALNQDYLGPAALNRAYTAVADLRERAPVDRLRLVAGDDGAYACRSVGNCVVACPVGINPLLSIILLRNAASRR